MRTGGTSEVTLFRFPAGGTKLSLSRCSTTLCLFEDCGRLRGRSTSVRVHPVTFVLSAGSLRLLAVNDAGPSRDVVSVFQ